MWKTALISARTFHASSPLDAKLGKVMKKVMGQTSKRRHVFTEGAILPSAEMFAKGSHEGKFSGNARRTSVLNKLFMKHITDLLATGEYSSEFVGHGIEINRVQITPDYNGLNIFWIAKGAQSDEVVEKLLKKNAGFLRHELSSLRVMGVVPKIYFVKDKRYSQLMEVDLRLAQADFGEDHEPTDVSVKLKTQLELYTHLPSAVKAKVKEIDAGEGEVIEDELPPMPQNVLGLNHADIMNRIRKVMKRSEALHRMGDSGDRVTPSINEHPVEYASNRERREAFKAFLQKRELERSKARKLEKNYYPDMEYMRQEFEERRAKYFRNLENYEDHQEYEDLVEEVESIKT